MAAAVSPFQIAAQQFGAKIAINVKEHKIQEDGPRYAPRSFVQKFSDSLDKTGDGPYRAYKLVSQTADMVQRHHASEGLANLSSMFKGCWTVTAFCSLPRAAISMHNAFVDVATLDSSQDMRVVERRSLGLISAVTEFASTVLVSAAMVMNCFKEYAKHVAQTFKMAETVTFGHDVVEAWQHGRDLKWASDYAAKLKSEALQDNPDYSPALKHAEESQTFYFLKVMKDVCSIAGFVLGIVGLSAIAMGVPHLGLTSAVIGLVGTLFAMSASLYQEGMQLKPLECFTDLKKVQDQIV